MAYPHSRQQMSSAIGTAVVTLAAAADVARFSSPYLKMIIRAVAIELNAAPGANGALRFDKRPTFGSDTGRGTGDVATVNLLTTMAAGKVCYKDGLNVVINPGEEVVCTVVNAQAALTAVRITIYAEPFYENPANMTNMVASS